MTEPDQRTHGAGFWVAATIGFAIMAFGAYQYLDATADFTRRLNLAVFIVGADVMHDLVLAPIVCLIGWFVWRVCPRVFWPPVRFGLIASGVLLLVALPGLRETGAVTGNPTVQPLNYATGFATALAVAWTIAAIWAVARLYRRVA